jgi:hypothetical protein
VILNSYTWSFTTLVVVTVGLDETRKLDYIWV